MPPLINKIIFYNFKIHYFMIKLYVRIIMLNIDIDNVYTVHFIKFFRSIVRNKIINK